MGSKSSRPRNFGYEEFRANVNPNSTSSRTRHGSTNSRTEQSSEPRSLGLRHQYHQLYRAAIHENWEDTAQVFTKCHRDAADAKKWALHFAVRTGKANDYLNNLIESLDTAELNSEEDGETALSIAAAVGSIEIVKLLVDKDSKFPYHTTTKEQWPLNVAAKYGNKEMVSCLLNVIEDPRPEGSKGEDPFRGKYGQLLLENLVNSALYGAALVVLKRCSTNTRQMCNLLTLLANQPFAFRSTSSLTLFQQLLYFISWATKEVQEIKLMHDQATELVKYLCQQLLKGGNGIESEANFKKPFLLEANFKKPFLLAAKHGMMEIVREILIVCPSAIGFAQGEDNILVLAVKNRNEDVLFLEKYLDELKKMAHNFKDKDENNILHIAARSAPENKLNSISNPDLQLRSESKWLNKVRELVPDEYYDVKNKDGKTPLMIFEREHKDLLFEGEEWIRSIAKPCRNVASLIMVIVFLSVITLYYCNIDIFSGNGFIWVGVADLFSMILSYSAVWIFAAILRFSHAYHDFHRTLRLSLLYGLGALFLSLIFMVIASLVTLNNI